MTYYCGSCLDKGRVTEITKDRINNKTYWCPYECIRIPRHKLERHRLRPTPDGCQTSLDDF